MNAEAVNSHPRPYPGLRPFSEQESGFFFGREGQSAEVVRRLLDRRFVMVVGTSGSGKSSLVRAGIVPTIQDGSSFPDVGRFRVVTILPGDRPVRSLASGLSEAQVVPPSSAPEGMTTDFVETALRRSSLGLKEAIRQAQLEPDTWVLIVVDQFEEVFRFSHLASKDARAAGEESQAFVRLLLETVADPSARTLVIATMRSDYLGDCSRFQGLPEAINAGEYLIPRMTREQRKRAILGPLACVRAGASAPLVQRLLNDAGDDPDHLPVLQHALARTWDAWKPPAGRMRPELEIADYERVGGMKKALSSHAEEAFDELTEPQQRAAERLFRALATSASANREARRPLRLEMLEKITEVPREELKKIIEVFRRPDRCFLMPPAGVALHDEKVIDISHESLIRLWDRLKKWTESEAQSAQIYRRLSDWAGSQGEGAPALWRDQPLQLAETWREEQRPNEFWASLYDDNWQKASAFLDASIAQRRRERRLRVGRVLAAVALVLITLGVLIRWRYTARVMEQQRTADEAINQALRESAMQAQRAKEAEQKLRISKEGELAKREAEDKGRAEAERLRKLADQAAKSGDPQATRETFTAAIAQQEGIGFSRDAAETRLAWASFLTQRRDWKEAAALLDQAGEIAERLGAQHLLGRVLENEALIEEARPRARTEQPASEASKLYARAEEAFRKAETPVDLARIKERQARILETSDKQAEAIGFYKESEREYRKGNDSLGAARAAEKRALLEPWGYLVDLQTGAKFEMPGMKDEVVMGRQGSINLGITEGTVSREHAVIRDRGKNISDLRSLNGTTVNAQFLRYGQPQTLRPGNVIVLGATKAFRFLKPPLKKGEDRPPQPWGLAVTCAYLDKKSDCVQEARYVTDRSTELSLAGGRVPPVTIEQLGGDLGIRLPLGWMLYHGFKKNDYDYVYEPEESSRLPLGFTGVLVEVVNDSGEKKPGRTVFIQVVRTSP